MKRMHTQYITTILFILSACSPTITSQPVIEPTLVQLPTPSIITMDMDALRLWSDRDTSVVTDRLGKGLAYAMALSPDGKTIAVTGMVSVSTYDFNSLQEIWTSLLERNQPPAPTGRGQVTWSPDSSQFATLSEVGITVWDAKTGEQLLIFKGNQYSSVSSVIWTEDGRVAALSHDGGNEILWDVETGEELFNIETNSGGTALDFVQSEGLLIRALIDRGIVVWDIHSKQELYPPLNVCVGCWINSLKVSPDGTRMAVAATAEREQLSVWDLKAGQQLFVTPAPENSSGTTFVWSPDSKYLAAAFNNGTIFVWDPENGTQVQVLSVDALVGLAWSLDGNNLITLSQYESLAVWDVKTGQPSRSLHEHTSWVMSLIWSPDGSMLASGAEDGYITLREASSGKTLRSFHDPAGWVSNLTWSPDGKEIAGGAAQNAIKIWDVQTAQQVQTWHVSSQAVVDLAWSPDGSILAAVSYEGGTILLDSSTGEQLRSLPNNYGSANLTWSPQGDRLSTSYPYPDFNGEQVTLWDSHSGEPVLTQKGMHDLAWSPLGDIVASISDNGTGFGRDDTTVVLWDPQTGKEIRSFNTGTFLTHIGWSPDGKLLVVSGAVEAEHALMVLDAQTGEQLHHLKGHYNVPSAVAWSPRGDVIASSSSDGTVIIWRILP